MNSYITEVLQQYAKTGDIQSAVEQLNKGSKNNYKIDAETFMTMIETGGGWNSLWLEAKKDYRPTHVDEALEAKKTVELDQSKTNFREKFSLFESGILETITSDMHDPAITEMRPEEKLKLLSEVKKLASESGLLGGGDEQIKNDAATLRDLIQSYPELALEEIRLTLKLGDEDPLPEAFAPVTIVFSDKPSTARATEIEKIRQIKIEETPTPTLN